MPRSLLFLIRGKLGDSLVLYAAVRQFRRQFPADRILLAIRRDYARLLAGEPGIELLPFGSRLEMVARLAWLRLRGVSFDVAAVLWGFGEPVRSFGRLVRARRRIHLDGRFPETFPEWPGLAREMTIIEPALRVMRMFEPAVETPTALEVPGLRARRDPARADAVGLVPVADELRRNLDPETLCVLLEAVRRRHPDAPLRVYVNPRNRGAARLLAVRLPEGARFVRFRRLGEVVESYRTLAAWYGTDTGLYHLAVAMGVPATVFFGPTQPWKIIMPAQPEAAWLRLAALGPDHCEEKGCAKPECLHHAVARWAGRAAPPALHLTPAGCPLRGRAGLDALARGGQPRP